MSWPNVLFQGVQAAIVGNWSTFAITVSFLRPNTPASPINAREAHAGQTMELLPTASQS
ncbi:MAG: hypothetical protein ABSB60_00590 [Terracidiphilus sp.]